jgi:uncharacterized protein (TIGR03435 family)
MTGLIRRLALVSGGSFEASLVAKATLLLLVGLGAMRVCRRSPAALRHALLAAMFGGLLMLPLFSIGLPTVAIAIHSRAVLPGNLAPPRAAPDRTAIQWPPASLAVTDARPPATSVAAGMRLVWAFGVLMLLLRLGAGASVLWRVHRQATVWPDGEALANRLAVGAGLRRKVAVVRHARVGVPLTYGCVRPVLLLPGDATIWRDSDLTRAFAHELEHVRRADWPMQLAAELACAFYWFLPLSWIALRRLRLESECACDDAVLRSVEPSVYADQLVRLARRLSAISAPAVLSMAGAGDLSTRIAAILNQRQRRGRATARVRLATASAAVALVAAVSPLRAVPRLATEAIVGEAPSGAIPQVEKTSVKPSAGEAHATFAGDPHARVGTQSGGLCPPFGWIQLTETCVNATNMTLRELVALAYGPTGLVPPRPQIVGGSDWTATARFDVVVRAAGNPPLQPFESGQLAMMVQVLLSQRFELALHHETRTLPIYALVQAPGGTAGAKLRPATSDCVREVEGLRAAFRTKTSPHLPAHPDACIGEVGGGGLKGGAVDMPQLATVLSNHLDRIVRDETRIGGMFQLTVRWGPARGAALSTLLQEQLGLRLVPTEGPVDVLMIDRVSRPTLN